MARQISPLPEPPSRSNPSNFAIQGDAFLGALVQFREELNAVALECEQNATTYLSLQEIRNDILPGVQNSINLLAPKLNPSIEGSMTLSTRGGWVRLKDESTSRNWDLHMHDGWLTIYDSTTGEHYAHTRLEQFQSRVDFGFGFQLLPNGLIFQWVLGPVVTGEYSVTVNLPTTYPHINLATMVSTHLSGRDAMFQTSDWQRANVTVFCNSMDSSGGALQPLIFSIGY